MEKRVYDIMRKNVYSLQPGESIARAMRYMTEKGVSSLPIINENGCLEGFVSASDLLKYAFKLGKKHDPLFAESMADISEADLEALGALKAELEQESVMTVAARKVPTVYIDDTYGDACRILGKNKVKKVAVLDHQQKVVGVLNRSIMLRHLIEYQLKRHPIEPS